MQVIKRSGKREDVSFDKITARIKKLCYGIAPEYIDPIGISMKVVQGLYDGVTTTELDNLAAEQRRGQLALSGVEPRLQRSFHAAGGRPVALRCVRNGTLVARGAGRQSPQPRFVL